MTGRYAVVGNPIAHSLSPRIHALFSEQTKQPVIYEKMEAPLDRFAETIRQLQDAGVRGVNVTLPFKPEAAAIADESSERARIAAAANTLTFRDDRTILADNTDGPGLVADLKRLAYPVAGRDLLIIGAGGACQGIVFPLLQAGLRTLTIANRTEARAENLARAVSDDRIQTCGLEKLSDKTFHGLINATSASLEHQVPDLPGRLLKNLDWGYDLVYAKENTAFAARLRQHGIEKVSDGIGMLVYQAAESFYLWHGVRPDAETVIAMLRQDEAGLKTAPRPRA